MSSVAEIAYFQVSKEYESGAVSLDAPIARHSKTPGLTRAYLGYETEDPTVLFWIDVWATRDDQIAFANHPDYATLAHEARPAFGSKPTVNVVEFEDTQRPFGAPITEFVTFTLKEGQSIAELERLVQEIHKELKKLDGTPQLGFHGASWAPNINKPNVYHGILGWDTVEAHWKAVSTGPLKERIDEVRAVADLWLVHAALKLVGGE